jgi:D-alanine-D-alanine ligase
MNNGLSSILKCSSIYQYQGEKMKIAIIYNRESQKVINLFGMANREKYGQAAIKRIVTSLKKGGHQVIALEGDKDLIDNLEDFMPSTLKGERPGMAFNLSYGIQGQARYTHVPGILEMVGVPYVGSGPLAHSLALDKVVAKMLFVQNDLPTPQFAVLQQPGFDLPTLAYPLIVKPKNESVSFGIKIVYNPDELVEAAQVIFDEFQQPVLVERFIKGREINVGVIGNGAQVEAFPVAELAFGDIGPQIYTMEDKKKTSGREVAVICPAELDESLAQKAQDLAKRAFSALGCYDCARVDFRMDEDGNLYLLEINSLPSLGEHGSYVAAAQADGLDFTALVNRLVDVASSRYFGTPSPPKVGKTVSAPKDAVFFFLTERRDNIEKSIQRWSSLTSRTDDPVGIRYVAKQFGSLVEDMGLKLCSELSDERDVWLWESKEKMEDGTLLVVPIDVPVNSALASEPFRRDPERLHGEGIGSSRVPLVMLEYCLRALKHIKVLNKYKLGVLLYADEGRDCVESEVFIKRAMRRSKRVLVLNPASMDDKIVTTRRGQRCYRVIYEGTSTVLGQKSKTPQVLQTVASKINEMVQLNDVKARTAVSVVNLDTQAFPRCLPHRAILTIQMSYPNNKIADELASRLIDMLADKKLKSEVDLLSSRPAMVENKETLAMFREFQALGAEWEIPLSQGSSLSPSTAGLVPNRVPVLCGLAPMAENLHTSRESVLRMSIVQRILLLTQFMVRSI